MLFDLLRIIESTGFVKRQGGIDDDDDDDDDGYGSIFRRFVIPKVP